MWNSFKHLSLPTCIIIIINITLILIQLLLIRYFDYSLWLQSAGVMSVYLFMKRYAAEEIYQPRHPSFYHPRLSNCSDHSGQFLHPEAWSRGRSPSDISSEASLQMSASYPALLKCPEYDHVSSSPCWEVGHHFREPLKVTEGPWKITYHWLRTVFTQFKYKSWVWCF